MRLPPGPWPWPVVGNLLQLCQGGKNLHKTFATLAQQYGPIVYLRLGSVPTVVVSSPMMAKEFLKTHDQEFQYRPKPTLAAEILMGNKGMVTTGGPLSQHLRRICFTELFATKHLQSFESMRTKEINNTINDIHMESEEGKVVDLKSRVSSLGINILTHMMFRKRCLSIFLDFYQFFFLFSYYCRNLVSAWDIVLFTKNHMNSNCNYVLLLIRYFGMDESKQNEIHCFKEVTTKVPHWLGILIISDYIPSLRWLVRLQGIEGSLHALRHKKSQFIQKLIAEHKNLTIEIDQVKDFGNENVAKTPKDFVDILLSAPQEDGTGNLSDETIETLILIRRWAKL